MQYYSSFNNPFDERPELVFTVTNAALQADNETITLVASAPIENCISLDAIEDDVQRETDNAFVMREVSYSTDGADWTPWNIVIRETSLADLESPSSILVRIRYTMVGTPAKPMYITKVKLIGTRLLEEAGELVTLKDDKPVLVKPDTVYKIFSISSAKLIVRGGDTSGVQAHFRFSQDSKRTWTKWIPFTEANMRNAKINPIRFCVFEFGFKRTDSGTHTILDIVIEGDFINVTENYGKTNLMGVRADCQKASGDCDNCGSISSQYKPTEKQDKSNFYNPYKVGQFSSFYNYMNQAVSDIWGHAVTYFRADPDDKGSDFILNEHQLYNIVDKKDVKVVVPRNQFPENKNNMSMLGLAFLDMFEIHITKEEFKQWFGVETRPGQNDALLFCDLNKMFLVDHVAAVRKAMNLETYYRVTLKTYSDKKNVKGSNKEMNDSIQQAIAHSKLGMLLSNSNKEEITKVVKPDQYKPLTAKKPSLTMDVTTKQVAETIANSSLVVAQAAYEIAIPTPRNKQPISYGAIDTTLNPGENRAMSMWFKIPKYDHSWSYTLLDNYSERECQGYKLVLVGGKLMFVFNDGTWELPVVSINENTWYCVLVNFDQVNLNVSIALYNRQHESAPTMARTSTLVLAQRREWELESQIGFEHDTVVNVGKSDRHIMSTGRASWYVTNIRIYSDVITDDVRDTVLNQYIVADEQLLILSDNCEKQMKLPKAGNL
jgi:hypothetical protein